MTTVAASIPPPPATQVASLPTPATQSLTPQDKKKRENALYMSLHVVAMGIGAIGTLNIAIFMASFHYIARSLPEVMLPQRQAFIDASVFMTFIVSTFGVFMAAMLPLTFYVCYFYYGLKNVDTKENATAVKKALFARLKRWAFAQYFMREALLLLGPAYGWQLTKIYSDLPADVNILSARNLLIISSTIRVMSWTIAGVKKTLVWALMPKEANKEGAIRLAEEGEVETVVEVKTDILDNGETVRAA